MKRFPMTLVGLALCSAPLIFGMGCGSDEPTGGTDAPPTPVTDVPSTTDTAGTADAAPDIPGPAPDAQPDVQPDPGPMMIPGCMDENAPNYNPNATIDDGSCFFNVNVTFNLDMKCAGQGLKPHIAGGNLFGVPGDNPMTDDDGDNIWTTTLGVAPYTGADYTFTTGACQDWSCKEDISGQDCAVDPYNDRHLDTTNEDLTINACFGVCGVETCPDECPAQVVAPPGGPTSCPEGEILVQFSVDMSRFPEVAEEHSIALQGPFGDWYPGQIMVEVLPNLYTATACLTPNTDYLYKFAGYQWTTNEFPDAEWEPGEPPCPGTTQTIGSADGCAYGTCTDRTFTTTDSDMVLDVNYWSECDTYAVPDIPGCTDPAANNFNPFATSDDGSCTTAKVNVTFEVDMGCAESVVTPHIAGGEHFGSPGDHPMTDDDQDGIWTVTIEAPANITADFTILTDACGDWSCKENIAGLDCAVEPYNDRQVTIGLEDLTVTTCYGQCVDGACGTCVEPPACPAGEIEATFFLDMSLSPDVLNDHVMTLQGSFAGWWPGIPMDEVDTFLYSATACVGENATHGFEFTGAEWSISEFPDNQWNAGEPPCAEITETSECSQGTCTNRVFTAGAEATLLDVYYWASCDAYAAPTTP